MSRPSSKNEFHILGPLDIHVAGQEITVVSGKIRILLTALLLQAGSDVSIGHLTEWLWDQQQPANPRGALHTCVRRLRKLLGDDTGLVTTSSTGYRIDVGEDELDLLRFRRLVGSSEGTDDPAERARLLTEALAIWRGQVLADIPSESLRRDALAGLAEERLTALESFFETELRLGRHSYVIKDLRTAAIDNPFRERFWGLLMLALYRAGRQAEALDVYQQVRNHMVEELGIEPGDKLRALQKGVLESDPSLAVSDGVQPGDGRPLAAPAQLPPEAIGFVGRQDLVDRASEVLLPLTTRTGVPIVVLSGPPGVGKTALAVCLGRRVRQSFPHGQLYVNLRGYEQLGQDPPLTPEQVLTQFLRSLGVPARQIPTELAEQINLYRSKMAGKNILVVLDNAFGIDQVMPLIPGEAGCSVLITSRHRLSGLVASQGAQAIQVGTLSPAESCELIEGMLGNARVTVGPEVVREVARLCAYLPLALRIAAANLINAPGGQIGDYLDNLRQGNRLAALSVEGDTMAAVSAAIAQSYDATEQDDRQMFRFAGLFPGAEFAANAIASLADTSTAQARTALNRLVAANLLQQHAPGRYQFHDLLREYARERASMEHTEGECAEALERLGQWYLVGVRNAVEVLHTEFIRLTLPPEVRPATEVPVFADESQAMAWLLAERRNLMVCVRFFGSVGPRYLSWYLADALRGFFWTGKYRNEWGEAARTGLIAAEACKDEHGTAAMHRSLANLYNTLGNYRQAMDHHRHSLVMHRKLGLLEEVAASLNNLSLAHLSLGQVDEAEKAGREALGIARDAGFTRIEAATLGLLGSIHWTRGDMADADAFITASLTRANELSLHHISAYSLRNLGLVRQATGYPLDARTCFTHALTVSERIDSFYDKSIALYGLALVDRDFGNHRTALDSAHQALVAFQECGDRTYEVETLCVMSLITEGLGDWAASARYAATALDGARQIDYADGEAYALARMAATGRALGRDDDALAHAEDAFRLVDDSANRITQTKVLCELGPMYLGNGMPERAAHCAERVLAVSESTGQRLGVARAKQILGVVAAAAGDSGQAHALWTEALEIFTGIGVPETEEVQTLLDSFQNPSADGVVGVPRTM
ncbi:AfsR/SARP family transcriptional regulator [Streptomyces jumonjinensis]|uniref:AfsR/SARP family transcriptional regulator n=1 Tax=Streptomyces jumonjinensis TaxID=1945 RepID=UPI0037B0A941